MRKKIINVGSSVGIVFSKQEREIYKIKLGGILDLDDVIFIKKKNKVKKNG